MYIVYYMRMYIYIYIHMHTHTHYSIVYVYCILYAIYIYISGISFESFMPWEEWVGLCWRTGDLRRGGMTSCQLHGKEPFASSHFLGLPWDCPGTALAQPCSVFPPILRVWFKVKLGHQYIPVSEISPAPWSLTLWDSSPCRAPCQSWDCQ